MTENEDLKRFKSIDLTQIARPDLGVKGFQDTIPKIQEIKSLFDELIDICETNDHIPQGLIDQLTRHVKTFISYAQQMYSYNLDQDGTSNFHQRTQLMNGIKTWHTQLMSGIGQNNAYNNFLTIYNTIKSFNLKDVHAEKQKINDIKRDFDGKKQELIDLLSELKKKASQEIVTDYAVIFQNQADKYSALRISFKPFQIKIGSAQLWLSLAATLILGFSFTLYVLYKHFHIDFTNTNNSTIILQLITRLIILSFIIYLVSFSFRQYSIQKHLFTLNKHRQNTLNSYNLFLKTIDKDDPSLRSALMMEVAKSIYDAGQTGYLTNKGIQDNSPSIIEMTRYLNKQ